jgi:hypothetical protein
LAVVGWWAEKLARREEVSSVFDFSKKGRRITEGPPDIIFLTWSVMRYAILVRVIRGGEYELHDAD